MLGYDPWLHTPQEVERLRAGVERAGAVLRAVADNPLDRVWPGRPAAAAGAGRRRIPTRFAGESAPTKRARIGKALAEEGAAAAVLTMPESIAWLLNIRGGDVPHTPLPLSFAILRPDGAVTLFIDRRKLIPGLDRHLGNAVTIEAPDRLGAGARRARREEGRVQVDPATAASWVFDRLGAAGAPDPPRRRPVPAAEGLQEPGRARRHPRRASPRRRGGDPLPRLAGARGAQRRACARSPPATGSKPSAAKANISAILSFPTISGAGSNGAIVHYRAMPETEKRLEPGTLYLLDSGAQYLDGTTDITRTVAIGEPERRDARPLHPRAQGPYRAGDGALPEGHDRLRSSTASRAARCGRRGSITTTAPATASAAISAVHEGPQRISKAPNAQPLLPGMIVSNEPGYYKTGAYGIRIENLVVVQPAEAAAASARCCASRR